MKQFALLFDQIDATTKTKEKVDALVHYFETADERDKVWVVALFTGRRPRRTVSSKLLRSWCAEYTGWSPWLLDESYNSVGDLSETIALLIEAHKQADVNNLSTANSTTSSSDHPLVYYINRFLELEHESEAARKTFMIDSWKALSTPTELYVFNKLLSGAFRVGVSKHLIIQALAQATSRDVAVIAHRISGQWDPSTVTFNELLQDHGGIADASKPYPFYLAYPLEAPISTLGNVEDWQVEWKWDGIRGQLIKRKNELFVWSRGEELMTNKFQEYQALLPLLPDGVVLDGEIIVAKGAQPLPFSLMQTRIGRKHLTPKVLASAPISFFAYDVLEYEGEDIREKPLFIRRALLEQIVAHAPHAALQLSPILLMPSWEDFEQLRNSSREHFAEGFMIKHKFSNYKTGRKRGDWWKWKIDPLTIDAVLIYAQKGSGRRSNLYTDYTFAVRDGEALVPFAKAYSGLTDKEIIQVDAFVKRHAIEKFGPVRTVQPQLVFELAFEGLSVSKRHKSGVSVRFPRIHRWRKDKTVADINTLADLKAMLQLYHQG